MAAQKEMIRIRLKAYDPLTTSLSHLLIFSPLSLLPNLPKPIHPN